MCLLQEFDKLYTYNLYIFLRVHFNKMCAFFKLPQVHPNSAKGIGDFCSAVRPTLPQERGNLSASPHVATNEFWAEINHQVSEPELFDCEVRG